MLESIPLAMQFIGSIDSVNEECKKPLEFLGAFSFSKFWCYTSFIATRYRLRRNKMAVEFKKGQTVFAVKSWDGKGKIAIFKLTIQSCGKKIVKATNEQNQFYGRAFYQQNINTGYGWACDIWMFSTDTENIEEIAKELGKKMIEHSKKACNDEVRDEPIIQWM